MSKCVACRYFREWSNDGGYCHRRAPGTESFALQAIGMLLQDLHWKAFEGEATYHSEHICFESEQIVCWPHVSKDDWCGEFESGGAKLRIMNSEIK